MRHSHSSLITSIIESNVTCTITSGSAALKTKSSTGTSWIWAAVDPRFPDTHQVNPPGIRSPLTEIRTHGCQETAIELAGRDLRGLYCAAGALCAGNRACLLACEGARDQPQLRNPRLSAVG